MRTLKIIDTGIFPYRDAHFLQKKIVGNIKFRKDDDHILLTEHPSVFTIGKSGSRKNILAGEEFIKGNGIEIIDIDRGGDITFHGEGQLVAYPIFDLNRHYKDIRLFIKNLERVLELTISEYGLSADKEKKHTGIWVNGKKIAFIGIGISSWITYHGISINANVDLEYFSMIRPCGIEGVQVGSLHEILKRPVDTKALKAIFIEKCCGVFGFEHCDKCSKDAFMVKEGVA